MSETITEIRALLMQFEQSGLKDMHIRSADWSVFMAQPGGAANPMQQAAGAPGADLAPSALAPAAPVAGRTAVDAPHLGIFVPVRGVGDDVSAGQIVAILDVLGRRTEVISSTGGRVSAIQFAANDLVEFGQTLVEIEAA